MESVQYKGYHIEAAPLKLADNGQWQIAIYIRLDTAKDTRFRNFSASNSYPTRGEAVQHCFQFGRKIIDGTAENLSVADL